MERIFSSPNSVILGMLRSRLETAGIACEVRNEALCQALPGAPFQPELWVLNDEDYPAAVDLLASWWSSEPRGAPEG